MISYTQKRFKKYRMFDEYGKTKLSADWIQCITRKLWLHESCTIYDDY